jgi:hypothetical protein
VIGLPTVLFLVFLGWRFLPFVRKLQRSQSHIMTTYYAFLWAVGLLNVLRCLALLAEAESSRPLLLNLLWLLTRFGNAFVFVPMFLQVAIDILSIILQITFASLILGISMPLKEQIGCAL